MSLTNSYNGLEIAIVGISSQFPLSKNYRQFWQNLREGKELLKTFTDEELRHSGVRESSLKDKQFVRTIGVLEDKDCFDAAFFGYTNEEAALMDPQIRLFHEHCWGALEDAGYSSVINKTRIGLFAGASLNENWKIYAFSKSANASVDPFYLQTITAQNFISTLVSYKLNLRGPSFYIDTACSTSLSAVHLACRSLLTRDCSIALAGGVCLRSEKNKGYFYKEGMISSTDGHCRTFDEQASGTAWGEGVGVVALKRLSEAINDRDNIYAVIRSTYVNNDGNVKVGYTAPGVTGQSECIASAQKLAGINPSGIGYIEAHGTATKIGDPIEIKALNEAFGIGGDDKFCAVGSVKSNMGHLDAAAGVAGLIKTALSLRYKQIPPSLHFNQPNPEIDFENGPFYVNAHLSPWERRNGTPLRAGVSSFGIGGTNVHAVLEEAPELEQEEQPSRDNKLLTVSAKTEESLSRYLQQFGDFLLNEPGTNLADMSYTLQTGRQHFIYRKSIVFRDRHELISLLNAEISNENFIKGSEKKYPVVFMFSGQGSQYINMGKSLYANEPLFRQEMDRGFSIIEKLTGENFKTVLFPAQHEQRDINETKYTQPLLFLLEYSLARMMMAYGIVPQYMIGHSIGEYTAACISGVFSFEDALKLVVKRGALMSSLEHGTMLSIAATAEEAKEYEGPGISIAAVNGPEQVVLSGDNASAEALINKLNDAGIPYSKLHTSHAFHSAMQDAILDAFKTAAQSITFNKPSIPFISNRSGNFIRHDEATSPEYWVRHLRETVRFSQGIQSLLALKEDLLFIEVGPGHSLTSLLKQHKDEQELMTVNLLPSAKQQDDTLQFFTNALGLLWSHGAAIDWKEYYRDQKRRRVSLPTYSFEPARYISEVNLYESGIFENLGVAANQGLSDWIFYPSWKQGILNQSSEPANGHTYVLFSHSQKFSTLLKGALLKTSNELVEILSGQQYERSSKFQYTIDPREPAHFEQLAQDLSNDGIAITDLIYSWGLATPASDDEQYTAYFSLVNIVKALAQSNDLRKARLTVVTGTLHKITGAEKTHVAQSLLLGLVNVLPQELGLWCMNIDIDTEAPAKEWMGKLLDEIMLNDSDRIVALRHGYRWVQDFQKNMQPVKPKEDAIRQGGVYLITGGLGNAGFLLSRHLLQRYNIKLVLTGRRKIYEGPDVPKEYQHEAWQRLAYLKILSNDVHYFNADVSSLEELKQVVEATERTVGQIDGVIHAAGVIDKNYFELIKDTTVDKASTVLAPKVKGVDNIYELFSTRTPAFVWLLSSTSSILGGLGFAAYAAANLYMDHFTSSGRDGLTAWKCMDLTGLAFTDDAAQQDSAAINAQELLELFEWSISFKGSNRVIVHKGDLAAKLRQAYAVRKGADTNAEDQSNEKRRRKRPDLAVNYMPAVTDTEVKLTAVFEEFFSMDNIGIEDPFFQLGGDSLKAMVLLKRIRTQFAVNLSLQELLFNSNIKDIAKKIDELQWLKTETQMENEITI